ncbi:oligopeptidase A [Pseudidiomarina sp. 1APP75-32.1]|uniref:oligopeptidase A n=1 Tax=Pseudidiomarina terrestris TaxID=2820060 RepID=A0AAW7QZY5_9GAMM|nr:MULTISPECIES: oligopeptidase A [unclassified Pseudidiomarina]MDN7125001.1 oligopeptidase A [Pseudidiomarina sp. 1APP75-32.1]MDN7129524.1 oligopeptidase A [Pseudidiomarina sp. 1APR75-15]
MSQNPLLSEYRLPPFDEIKPEHIVPAIEARIAACKATIEKVLEQKDFSWKGLVASLEDQDDLLERSWSPVAHLNAVVSSTELREAHDACLPMLSDYGTFVGQHQGLFKAFQALKASDDYATLSEAQRKVIDDTLRDFELSGIALPEDKKKRYAEIQTRLSDLASTFSNQLLDATDGWHYLVTDEQRLSGLPESAVDAAASAAAENDQQGWRFTLAMPSYLPVMMYADDAELRKVMYQAFTTRASDQGPQAGEFDNTAVMAETLALRHELAQLLGFRDYAELSLATKMAESANQVEQFLMDLAERSLPQAHADYQEVLDFAQSDYGINQLEAWDVAYFSEKLKQQKYAISDEELRPYFPEEQVLKGLFTVVERLFGINVEEQTPPSRYHDNLRYFVIGDSKGELRGSFYLDLYARNGKRGGAWMAECAVRRVDSANKLQFPIAYLTCNFNKPVGDKPALFTHDEVLTLFHEFGHGLHHMLTKVDVAGVSGINGVAWDAVELPSQFLENWCWEPEALAVISGHYETGDPLPEDLLNKMLAARNFQSAMQMVRQLEFSLFDLRIHRDYDPAQGDQIQAVLDTVRDQVAVRKPPAYNRFQHGFGHIFAGGYAAGYYSYKWAEVLSADAFSRFEEEGIFNYDVGRDFLEAILERGGSREAMQLFKEFRGREPQVEALLSHSGITSLEHAGTPL